MFNNYEPNVKATIAFLKMLQVKVTGAIVNETLQNHPDWPSLLCIGDSLSKWGIANGAGKIESAQIDELPVPFLAYTNNREFPLAIVRQVNNAEIRIYTKEYSRPKVQAREEFLKKWDGVYLIAEPDEKSGEKEYEINKRKAFFSSLIPILLFLALLSVSFLALQRVVNSSLQVEPINTAGIYLQYLILTAGVAITSLLLWYEIDKNNPILQKVCTGVAKGNCNAILTGKQAKLFSWLSWSEVGFFYFTGGLIILLFSANNNTNIISFLAWLNILALTYAFFSIYYQWQVAKQWCVLCLGVQALLLLGAANIGYYNFLLPFSALSPGFAAKSLLLYALPMLVWYSVKPLFLGLQQARNTKREYLRIKFNTVIFETLLKKQKQITLSTNGLGIDIGNAGATNTIVKVCNPYCGPCANAHPKIEKLLEANQNLKVKIIFSTPNANDHPSFQPVNHLMAIAGKAGAEEKIKKALDDWYLEEKKDYNQFAAKYPMNGELQKQGGKIEAMYQWCDQVGIQATPTIFLNGYQLPDAYDIEDLQYFLLE